MRAWALILIACLGSPGSARAARADRSSWSSVLRLEQGTLLRVHLRDGSLLEGRVARVDTRSLVLLDFSRTTLTKDEEKAVYRAFQKSSSPQVSLRGGVLQLESITRSVAGDEVREIYRFKKRGSVLGAVIGVGVGIFIGLIVAVNLAFKECGGSCTDEKVGIILAGLGIPTLGGFLGYYVGSGERLVYRAPALP